MPTANRVSLQLERETACHLARAASFYQVACDGGDALGCFNLAELLANGRGVDKDEASAALLYERACAGGVQDACGKD